MPQFSPNRLYNDPALGAAFSNLAQVFAPPSGSDLAGYAAAAAAKEKAGRLAELFRVAQDPSTDWSTLDRLGIGAGVVMPNQTLEAVDRNNATQRYGYDTQASTSRANNAADNTRALQVNSADNARALQQSAMDNQRTTITSLYGPLSPGQIRPAVPADIAGDMGLPAVPEAVGAVKPLSETEVKGAILQGLTPEEQRAIGLKEGAVTLSEGQVAFMPDGTVARGARAPLSETEWRAQQNDRLLQNGSLTDQQLVDAVLGQQTPVQAVGADGKTPMFMSPGAAVREGAQPYDKPSDERLDNYLAVGPGGQEKRFVGYVGNGGRIYDANTGQPVPNVLRKEGSGGGMSFETDGQGGIKLSTGNAAGMTTARVTDLQRQETEAGRAVNELSALFDALRPDDLGAAGNINQLLTDYGAQAFPTLARPDVAATRAQLKATTLGLAKSLVGDERLSDSDRRAANDVMVSDGLGESLPGAQAKLASLIALSAYRKAYSSTVRVGGTLPPLDGAMLGKLVDDGAISPRVAEVYAKNVLRHAPEAGDGIVPGVLNPEDGTAAASTRQAAAGSTVPTVATPEEAMKLAPGTKFRTPDGQLKVRP